MPFGVVRGRSKDGCIRWGGDRRREWAVLGVNLGRPIVTNGVFATRSSQITLRTCCGMSRGPSASAELLVCPRNGVGCVVGKQLQCWAGGEITVELPDSRTSAGPLRRLCGRVSLQ